MASFCPSACDAAASSSMPPNVFMILLGMDTIRSLTVERLFSDGDLVGGVLTEAASGFFGCWAPSGGEAFGARSSWRNFTVGDSALISDGGRMGTNLAGPEPTGDTGVTATAGVVGVVAFENVLPSLSTTTKLF